MICYNIDKERNRFLNKSFSVGHHNVKYTQTELGMCLISCANARESFEEGVSSPSPQTVRDRLQLNADWDAEFENSAMKLAKYAVKRYPRSNWHISVDETHDAFFGDVKSKKKHSARYISGFKNKVKGATGSFEFLVVSLSCNQYKIPLFTLPIQIGISPRDWLEIKLALVLKIVPKATVLADRGFSNVWFLQLLEKLNCKYIVRITLRDKKVKAKFSRGNKKVNYFMKEAKTNVAHLLTVYKVKDKRKLYYFTSNLDVKPKRLLSLYMLRWDIENIFKLSDRALIKTSSANHRMRLFCLIVSFFLYLLWQFSDMKGLSLRRFVKQLIHIFSKICKYILDTLGRLVPS